MPNKKHPYAIMHQGGPHTEGKVLLETALSVEQAFDLIRLDIMSRRDHSSARHFIYVPRHYTIHPNRRGGPLKRIIAGKQG